MPKRRVCSQGKYLSLEHTTDLTNIPVFLQKTLVSQILVAVSILFKILLSE